MVADKICVAKILTAHGVRGEVKLRSFMENHSLFVTVKEFETVEKPTEKLLLQSLRGKKDDVYIASFSGIEDRDQALQYRGTELYISRGFLPEIEESDEYYVEDLVGSVVYIRNEEKRYFGIVKAMHNFGAGDIIEIIEDQTGQSHMLPFVESIITSVDLDHGRITLKLPEQRYAKDDIASQRGDN